MLQDGWIVKRMDRADRMRSLLILLTAGLVATASCTGGDGKSVNDYIVARAYAQACRKADRNA